MNLRPDFSSAYKINAGPKLRDKSVDRQADAFYYYPSSFTLPERISVVFGVLINELAGRRKSWETRLRRAFPDLFGNNELAAVTKRPKQVPSEIDKMLNAGIEYLVICGGDGTMQVSLSELISQCRARKRAIPGIIPLKGGTINSLAQALGVNLEPDRHLQRFLECYETRSFSRIKKHKLLQVGDSYGFVLGMGSIAEFIRVYNESGHYGQGAVIRLIGKLAFSLFFKTSSRKLFRPMNAKVAVDGEKTSFEKHTVLIATTIKKTGFGLHIGYRLQDDFDRFHVWCTPRPIKYMAHQFPKFYFGLPLKTNPLLDKLAERVEIDVKEKTTYTLDGEIYYTDKKIEVTWGPGIEFILG